MRGEAYQYDYTTDSVDNFFFEVADDEYDSYIQDLFDGIY